MVTLLNHERYQVIAFAAAFCLAVWFVGCEPETKSLIDPDKMVSRTELQAELDLYLATAERRFAELDQKAAIQKWVLDNAALFTQTGDFNSAGLLSTLFAVLGVGALTDNVRKRAEIKRLTGENVS